MRPGHVVFLLNLLQDVNIVRPLALLAHRDLAVPVFFLVSDRFLVRDTRGTWQRELRELCSEVRAEMHVYDSVYSALQFLQHRRGLLIAASESNLSAHSHTHDVMRVAPPQFLKLTLQHGYECVGFLQSRDHERAHGRRITFAADVVCGWCDVEVMRSLAPSERPKYVRTGATALLYEAPPAPTMPPPHGGLVCENLHSVRMHISGDFRTGFMETFTAFCEHLDRKGESVTLRPHPGGQYVLKNNVEVPKNVTLNNHPMYKVDLTQYAYGISAPSSIIIDMVLAGIPAAVWQDESGTIDTSCYEGLTTISSLDEWIAFARDATLRRDAILQRQQRFLERSGMLTDRAHSRKAFLSLMRAGLQGTYRRARVEARAQERVMLVANGLIPTLQLSFLKPLEPEIETGRMAATTLVQEELVQKFADFKGRFDAAAAAAAKAWIRQEVEKFRPTTLVLCRYSDYFAEYFVELARDMRIPLVYHIDDDLLNVPIEIGLSKYRAHNRPDRLARVRFLLDNADLLYCSTRSLMERFRSLGITSPMTHGEVYCTARVMRRAVERPVRKIGYMGFDHASDLAMILPALVQILRSRPDLEFELFGSIPKPPELDEFGDRVTTVEPVRAYTEFMEKFATLDWDIGFCPLVTSAFNSVKANTKWVEYTAVGAAVVSSPGMAYDECSADGCGVLAGSLAEWVNAVNELCEKPELRYGMVVAAQRRLETEYNDERLRAQIRRVFSFAHASRTERAATQALGAPAAPVMQEAVHAG